MEYEMSRVKEMTNEELQEDWDKLQSEKIELQHRIEMIINSQNILSDEMYHRLEKKLKEKK